MISNKEPSRSDIKKWGILAYLSDVDRKSLMDSPAGEAKGRMKALEREVADMKKKRTRQLY